MTLVLLLFVGLVIGQLAGRQRDRERLAASREREARALFAISRELATGASPRRHALGSVLQRLGADAGLARAWIGIGPTISQERVRRRHGTRDGDPAPAPRTPSSGATASEARRRGLASAAG